MKEIDLKQEQQRSLERSRYNYSLPAKFFFFAIDTLTGKKTTLSKLLMIELHASIPYRAWELRMYSKLTMGFKNRQVVKKALEIMEWSRDAQDNEYWHVLAVEAIINEHNEKRAWYLNKPTLFFMISFYIIFTRTLALFNLRRAFVFNGEFEDHAEYTYAEFVRDNPELENQKVKSQVVLDRMPFENWADVFRRIGLDERDHRNDSFIEAGMPEYVDSYDGGPNLKLNTAAA